MKKESRKFFNGLAGRFVKKTGKKAAMPPGTLIYVGEERTDRPSISVLDYDEQTVEIRDLDQVEETFPYKDKPSVSWINVDGVHDIPTIEKLGLHYGIHPLVLEDIVHTRQRPKLEEHDGYFYFVLKMFTFDDEINECKEEQVSLLLGQRFVLSFQERKGDVFGPIRDRIKDTRWRHKRLGADYLVYALVDAIVDHYFLVLEKMGLKIEDLETQVSYHSSPKILEQIYGLKREMLFLKKSMWPLRELLGDWLRVESSLVKDDVKIYIRDVYDHIIQIVEIVESYRDMISGLQDLYLSMVSNRMNDVMKVLTIIATIFIPPTFIAGIYGMNFDNMPELHAKLGYFIVLGVMLVLIALMLLFFKRKKWF